MQKPKIFKYKDRIEYRVNGVLHREDGPAIEWWNGDKDWCQHGEFHRKDGPAIECSGDGTKMWYKNGKLHREDGPAVVFSDIFNEWNEYWINGVQMTEEEFNNRKN